MLHKRYVVRYLMKTQWDREGEQTEFCSDLTYLNRKDAEDFANSVRGLSNRVQVNEFLADFQVPAVVIPYEWLR